MAFDDYTFRIAVSKRDLQLAFEDRRGVFDVRDLSGAESRCFTVLLMLAMLPTLPSARRSNLLVLYEMDVNMDGFLKDRFCNLVLPVLLRVVTPSPETFSEGRHCTVRRTGVESVLDWVA